MNSRSTEHSHVKTNLVHTLFRVQKYGLLPLERFIEMLRPLERRRCVAQPGKKQWSSMPIEVFTAFVFRVRHALHLKSLKFVLSSCRGILLASDSFITWELKSCWCFAPRDFSNSRCCDLKAQWYYTCWWEEQPRVCWCNEGWSRGRVTKLTAKMGKLLAVANSTHGPSFLEEVHDISKLFNVFCMLLFALASLF